MEPAATPIIPDESSKNEPPSRPGDGHRPNLLPSLLAMFLLGGGLVAGGFYLGGMSNKNEAPAVGVAPDDLKSAVAKLEASFDHKLATLERRVESADPSAIDAKIEPLAKRVDELAAEPTPSIDLKPIEEKVAGLGEDANALNEAVGALKSDLNEQKEAIAALRARIDALPKSAEASPTASTPAASDSAADVEARMTRAVELFRKNEFGPARDEFAKLRSSNADDARLWYYSALATGFATNEWGQDSETLRFVTRGLELERQGKPDKSSIDAAFANLAPSAKAWLDAFRNRVAR